MLLAAISQWLAPLAVLAGTAQISGSASVAAELGEPPAHKLQISDPKIGQGLLQHVVVVLVGYLGVRNESDVALQVPYLLSGGLGGLALVGLGALGLLQYQLRVQSRNNARLIEELDVWKESALVEVRRFLEGAEIEVSVEAPAQPVPATRRPPAPAGAPA